MLPVPQVAAEEEALGGSLLHASMHATGLHVTGPCSWPPQQLHAHGHPSTPLAQSQLQLQLPTSLCVPQHQPEGIAVMLGPTGSSSSDSSEGYMPLTGQLRDRQAGPPPLPGPKKTMPTRAHEGHDGPTRDAECREPYVVLSAASDLVAAAGALGSASIMHGPLAGHAASASGGAAPLGPPLTAVGRPMSCGSGSAVACQSRQAASTPLRAHAQAGAQAPAQQQQQICAGSVAGTLVQAASHQSVTPGTLLGGGVADGDGRSSLRSGHSASAQRLVRLASMPLAAPCGGPGGSSGSSSSAASRHHAGSGHSISNSSRCTAATATWGSGGGGGGGGLGRGLSSAEAEAEEPACRICLDAVLPHEFTTGVALRLACRRVKI